MSSRLGCAVSLPYGWRTQNPFNSIYLAAQCMAAELSTGALAMLAIQSSNESVSMLVTNMEASFGKKATERSTFLCTNGLDAFNAIQHTITTVKGWLSTCIQSAPCQMEINL